MQNVVINQVLEPDMRVIVAMGANCNLDTVDDFLFLFSFVMFCTFINLSANCLMIIEGFLFLDY